MPKWGGGSGLLLDVAAWCRLNHLVAAVAIGLGRRHLLAAHAHGLELPDMSSPWTYAAGFVLATAALHTAGYGLVRVLPQAAAPLVRVAGAVSAGMGAWLLAG